MGSEVRGPEGPRHCWHCAMLTSPPYTKDITLTSVYTCWWQQFTTIPPPPPCTDGGNRAGGGDTVGRTMETLLAPQQKAGTGHSGAGPTQDTLGTYSYSQGPASHQEGVLAQTSLDVPQHLSVLSSVVQSAILQNKNHQNAVILQQV